MKDRIIFRKYGLFLLIAILLCILQQAIFSRIVFLEHSMDIVFVFLICFSLMMDDLDSVIFALMCGLLRDSFFPYIFGLNTILYIVAAFAITHINRRIYKDTIIIPVLVTFGATAIKGLLYFSFLFIASIRFEFYPHAVDAMLYESILNALLCIFVFRAAKKIINIKVMQQEWKF